MFFDVDGTLAEYRYKDVLRKAEELSITAYPPSSFME